MIDPQLLESLTDIDFMPENQFPRKFDLKKFDLAINAYRELFTEILGGKSELEDELMYVPRENQNAFLVRFGKKLEKLLQLALAKREKIIRHFLFLWVMDSSIKIEFKGEFFSISKTTAPASFLFEIVKDQMEEPLKIKFEHALLSNTETYYPRLIKQRFNYTKTATSGDKIPMPAICLMHYYLWINGEGEAISNNNKDSIALKYQYTAKTSGKALRDLFKKFQSASDRKNSTGSKRGDTARKNDFDLVIENIKKLYPEALKSLAKAEQEKEFFINSSPYKLY